MSVKSVNRSATSGRLLAAVAAAAIGALAHQSPAYANDAAIRGFLSGVVGGMVGNMLIQQHFHGGGGYSRHPSHEGSAYHPYSGGAPSNRSRPAGNGPPPSPEESSRALASLAPPTTQEEQVIL